MSDFRIFAKFSGVDKAKRIVYGVATMDTEDSPDFQGDVVDYNGSLRAFRNWEGNIREMHVNKAVGRCVKWWGDSKTKSIRVAVRISKGAEDTWQKILDKTLRGFSIAGRETRARKELSKRTGGVINRILDYALQELSLVDVPANPHCKITAITKRGKTLVATDVLSDISEGARGNMPAKQATSSIRDFGKGLQDGDEVLMIRKSDIEKDKDGRFILKNQAPTSRLISKSEMEDAGLTSEGEGTEPEENVEIDLDGHAKNMAKAHHDIVKMIGGDPDAHYADATREEGEGTGEEPLNDAGGSGNGEGGLEMARRVGNLRKQRLAHSNGNGTTNLSSIEKLIEKAITPLAKTLEDMRAANGTSNGVPAPRKTDGNAPAGQVLEKTLSDATQMLQSGSAERYTQLQKSLGEYNARAKEIIAKTQAGHKLTPQEDIERRDLGEKISKAKVEMAELEVLSARS
jgi:hypothetical protein